ncbi:conserved hypothetical protein [Ricinus communis]|uniref:Uncharacterized protein n=1 Tax=Ricinus communis TaxID=3988 RepID=B9SMS8_RICCO|nr:conserved hypothetical protein [Ricinus communis]
MEVAKLPMEFKSPEKSFFLAKASDRFGKVATNCSNSVNPSQVSTNLRDKKKEEEEEQEDFVTAPIIQK